MKPVDPIEIIGDMMLIAFGVIMLYIFISISVTGGYMAVENNGWIRWGETAMGALLLILGIQRLVHDMRK